MARLMEFRHSHNSSSTNSLKSDHPLPLSENSFSAFSPPSPMPVPWLSLPATNSGILLLQAGYIPLPQASELSNKERLNMSVLHRNRHNALRTASVFSSLSAERRFLLRGKPPSSSPSSSSVTGGDEISARYDRRVGGSAPPGSASGQSSPRWERDASFQLHRSWLRHHCSETWRSSACRRENSLRVKTAIDESLVTVNLFPFEKRPGTM